MTEPDLRADMQDFHSQEPLIMEKETGNKFRILIVDNTPESLDITVSLIKKAGYSTLIAGNGEECMKLIHEAKPDIILVDGILPDISIKNLCKRIKNTPELASIYIILLSALKISSDNVSEGLEEGADGYIRKPVGSRELLARINAACRISAAENEIRAGKILLEACINSPAGMIVLAIDKQFNYLAFNTYHKDVMLKAYGREIKPGMNLIKCITNKDDAKKSKINYEKALNGASHITIEEYGDLDRQFYETRYSPIYNAENEIIGCTAFSSNVTGRMLMEKSLKRSEEKFRKAFITSPDAISINRLKDGMYVSVNEGFTKISGYPEEEIIGKTSVELEIWAKSSDREKLLKRLKATGNVDDVQTRFRMKDGSFRDGILSASIIDLDGIPHILSITKDVTERKRVEEALLRSKEQYDNLVSKIQVGIYVLHSKPDGTFAIDYVSTRMEELLSLTVKELLADAKSIFKNIHPDDLDGFIRSNQEGIQHSRPFDWKGRILDKGKIKWLQISSTPELQENGDVLWHGIVVDITERKLAEDALRGSEETMRFIVRHDPNAIAVFDLKLNYIAVSNRYLHDYNVSEEDIIGKHHYDVFPEMPQKWKDVHQRCLRGATEGNDDDWFERPDGSITYNRWECLPWRRVGGEIGGIITYTEVTTDRKLAQEALKERSRDLQNELEKKRKAEIELQESYKQLEISKIATFNLLEAIKIEMGERRKVEDEIHKLNNELEQRVNERTAQLEAANKELQAFAYSVSHDLRSPLRAIDGFSRFVLEDYGAVLDPEGKRLLGLIRSNTQKMDQLIVDILALSKVTRSEHKVSKVDMNKMALSMFNEVATSEMQKNISFIVDPLPESFSDPTYLKQVWINLISNAIKFSSLNKNPEIKVGGYSEKGFHIYFVKDNGVGFDPDYAHKLFGVFQRLHKVDEFEGTGVGLAIVQRIIHKHGGKVWAEAIEGKGATFYFSIPVKKNGK